MVQVLQHFDLNLLALNVIVVFANQNDIASKLGELFEKVVLGQFLAEPAVKGCRRRGSGGHRSTRRETTTRSLWVEAVDTSLVNWLESQNTKTAGLET